MEERKKAHIDLAFQSRVAASEAKRNFNYEPLLSAHTADTPPPFEFAGKTMRLPVWISSMTGGASMAGHINRNLARVCKEFGLGMGLGSCRVLLENETYLSDFDVRHILGDDCPFYANMGIAQLEKMLKNGTWVKIEELVSQLKADGIIIHVNPLQEAFQPEGDLFMHPPFETIQHFLEKTSVRVIVKEVGQGMGPESMKALLNLPLQAIEFGALGGTNFTKLELARHQNTDTSLFETFSSVGHTAAEMTQMVNQIFEDNPTIKCRQIIISGGIQNILDGYYLVRTCKLPAVFGMGSGFLKHASADYESLHRFGEHIHKSLILANNFLKIK